ncbi:hypothetical protein GALL_304300 [mine drainage metagenome]|uniref:DNA primase n=1 Tax=mine drainage metagenome TaxID=410659 RepID=A0A1J5RHY6_9ZZZZ
MSKLELLLLPRLNEVRKAPARSSAGIIAAWRAACPVCGGHGRPLSLGVKSDGGAVGHCFGGHDFVEVLDALGLDWSDILPDRPWYPSHARHAGKGNGGPTAWAGLKSAIDAMLQASALAIAAGDNVDARMTQDIRMAELRDAISEMSTRVAKAEGLKS